MTARVRLLLVEDQALVRAGVRRVLESDPAFEVVGEAESGDQALALARTQAADVMVLDLNLPGRDGFEVLHELRRLGLQLKVLVLSLHADSAYVARAVREGAAGYLLKENAVQELPAAIRAVTSGQRAYSPRVQDALSEMVRSGEPRDPLDRLSAREREVARRVAAGRSSKEIAAELNLSVRTIESHRASLMKKLGLRSVAELTRFAVENGLLRHP